MYFSSISLFYWKLSNSGGYKTQVHTMNAELKK
jgi:hypothetical protein